MAEPSIKNSLASPEFTTDVSLDVRNRLTSCLKLDSANIRPKIKGGQDGPHVEAIQKALTKLRSIALISRYPRSSTLLAFTVHLRLMQ